MLIAFEGIDCSGKDTQVFMLKESLESKGYSVGVMAFPRKNTLLGKDIYRRLYSVTDKTSLSEKVALELLMDADRHDAQKEIARMISFYDVVILNRYILSGYVYGVANSFCPDWKKSLQLGLVEPSLTFILDLPVEESMSRKRDSRDQYEKNTKLQSKVRELYLEFSFANNFHIIDASKKAFEVHKNICDIFYHSFSELERNKIEASV